MLSLLPFKPFKPFKPSKPSKLLSNNPQGYLQPAESAASPAPGPARTRPGRSGVRHATADFDFTEADADEEADYSDQDAAQRRRTSHSASHPSLSVLPLLSSGQLDSLPVYDVTHAIRALVCSRSETALSWDQLRSPQIFQFLIKPMQEQLRAHHFSRATLFALMANCLQFSKDATSIHPTPGTSTTRAEICQLLAIKLVREYTTRDLLDVLSYQFCPLQGMPRIGQPGSQSSQPVSSAPCAAFSRASTLDVAIRASAKYFLAHPVVVQHLDAIWSGAICFHSASDNLHCTRPTFLLPTGSTDTSKSDERTPLLGPTTAQRPAQPARRSVALYNPRLASLDNLSRLRVPRYRFVLMALSHSVLIGLFLAVLVRRSAKITGLELVFWFWSAGFMLDELVGFDEHGFSLYIITLWNVLDLAILLLLMLYYGMRAYGIFLLDPHHWNAMAYDVLAANAILLLPRSLGLLNHFQYLSHLLLAFRLIAVDLAAVLLLLAVICSGFVAFFALSMSGTDHIGGLLGVFQLLLGRTSTVWDSWPTYSLFSKTVIVVFLLICHFAVLATMIAVSTVSFMAVATRASDEYHFVFAVNTMAMVKNDSLFPYIPPTGIFAWLLMPFRYFLPLKTFVRLNRLIIKLTHFPVLFCIYTYEKYWLAPFIFEPTDLVEHSGRARSIGLSFADPATRMTLFSPNVQIREHSIAGFHRDWALEAVFRRTPDVVDPMRTQAQRRKIDRRKTQKAVRTWQDETELSRAKRPWMDSRRQQMSEAIPWNRRYSMGRDSPRTRHVFDNRSAASDPANLASNAEEHTLPPTPYAPHGLEAVASLGTPRRAEQTYKDLTDADGDDELVTNEEDEEEDGPAAWHLGTRRGSTVSESDVATAALRLDRLPLSLTPSLRPIGPRRSGHGRTLSSNTILFHPVGEPTTAQPAGPVGARPEHLVLPLRPRAASGKQTGPVAAPSTERRRPSPRRSAFTATGRAERPPMPWRGATDSMPNFGRPEGRPRKPRAAGATSREADGSATMSNDIRLPGCEAPSSFQAQVAAEMLRTGRLGANRARLGRLVLARLRQLEDTFAEVVREIAELRGASAIAATAPAPENDSSPRRVAARDSNSDSNNNSNRNRKGKGRDENDQDVFGSL